MDWTLSLLYIIIVICKGSALQWRHFFCYHPENIMLSCIYGFLFSVTSSQQSLILALRPQFPVMWWCSHTVRVWYWSVGRHTSWCLKKKIRLMRERPQAEWNEDVNAQRSFIHCVLVYSSSQQILVLCEVFCSSKASLWNTKENSPFPEDTLFQAPLLQLPRICIFALWCPFNSVKCVLRRRTSAWPTQGSCNPRSCFS